MVSSSIARDRPTTVFRRRKLMSFAGGGRSLQLIFGFGERCGLFEAAGNVRSRTINALLAFANNHQMKRK
jgi:hypothetical protein